MQVLQYWVHVYLYGYWGPWWQRLLGSSYFFFFFFNFYLWEEVLSHLDLLEALVPRHLAQQQIQDPGIRFSSSNCSALVLGQGPLTIAVVLVCVALQQNWVWVSGIYCSNSGTRVGRWRCSNNTHCGLRVQDYASTAW